MNSSSVFDVVPIDTDRSLVFQSIVNFRDLGGLPAADGAWVRRGLLFRSATLHMATPDDALQLRRLGVRNVIDLRTEAERVRWPAQGAWSPEHVLHAPLLRETWDRTSLLADVDPVKFLAERYLDMINGSGDVIATVLEFLADANTGPTVFHCAAGKDRTGVIAAVILGLLGVNHDVIADDYHLTATAMADLQLLFGGGDPTEVMVNMPAGFLTAPRDAMALMLQTVRLEWRSMAAYARSIGVGDDTLRGLRNRTTVR
jgi:protein-tyrosine phosphatase